MRRGQRKTYYDAFCERFPMTSVELTSGLNLEYDRSSPRAYRILISDRTIDIPDDVIRTAANAAPINGMSIINKVVAEYRWPQITFTLQRNEWSDDAARHAPLADLLAMQKQLQRPLPFRDQRQ